MKCLVLLVFLKLAICVGSEESGTRTSLHLLAILSHSGCSTDAPRQERGFEILSAAHIAIDEINRLPNILPGYFLQLTEIVTDRCNAELALVEAVKLLSDDREMTVGIIGLFCSRITEIISQLATPFHGLVQLSGSTNPALRDTSRYPYLFHMLPSSAVYAEAVFSLMKELGWSRLGILYARCHDTSYFSTAQAFSQSQSTTTEVSFYGEVTPTDFPDFPILQDLCRSGTKITLLLLPHSEVSEFLCTAYTQGLRWPNYGWIVLNEDEQSRFTSSECSDETMKKAIEGILMLSYQLQPDNLNVKLISGITYNEYLQNLHETLNNSNPYANVLYDSVWTFALALNKSVFQDNLMSRNSKSNIELIKKTVKKELPKVSFNGTLGNINFGSDQEVRRTVNIFHVKNDTTVPIGYYKPVQKLLTLDSKLIGPIPSDELERLYQTFPIPITIIFSITVVIGILFTTMMLVLFICYRNEPEVKASSWFLSLFMFLGCYFLFIGTLVQVIPSGLVIEGAGRKTICGMITGLCSIGLDLILATLFTKMLRIYRVFSYFGKTGKAWSDTVLIIFILLLISGKVTIFVLWAFVDNYYLEDIETYNSDTKPPHYDVVQHCYCEHTGIWLTAIFVYSGTLFISLLLLAVKTRKIRRENFKDTKKVNAFILTIIIDVSLTVSLWWVLRTVGDPTGSKAIIAIGYGLAATACQFCLAAPKALPPFLRHLRSKHRQSVTYKFSNASSDPNSTLTYGQNTSITLVT